MDVQDDWSSSWGCGASMTDWWRAELLSIVSWQVLDRFGAVAREGSGPAGGSQAAEDGSKPAAARETQAAGAEPAGPEHAGVAEVS